MSIICHKREAFYGGRNSVCWATGSASREGSAMHREITEITDRPPQLIGQLLEVWERSVRATHLFLSAGEVAEIKP